MVTVLVSEYVLDTFGYVLYKHGLLMHTLTKNELPEEQRGAFNTTCTNVACFGLLVPRAAAVYPGASVEVEILASSYPTVSISTDGIHVNCSGVINFYARLVNGSLAPMFKTRLSVTTSLTASLNGTYLRAVVVDLSPMIEVTESDIGHISDPLLNAAFVLISNLFLIPKLNAIGAKGIPIPNVKDVRFTSTRLELADHCVRIAADVEYSP